MNERAEAFWLEYLAAAGPQPDGYEVATLGDGAALSEELVGLVLAGTKRATASLVSDFEGTGEPLPRIGGHAVVVDHAGAPRLIWRTTEVRIGPMRSCDEAFARDEGEGERTLEGWLDGHRRYFARQGLREGFAFDETATPVVFERFRAVWPPDVADPEGSATSPPPG